MRAENISIAHHADRAIERGHEDHNSLHESDRHTWLYRHHHEPHLGMLHAAVGLLLRAASLCNGIQLTDFNDLLFLWDYLTRRDGDIACTYHSIAIHQAHFD